MFKKVIMMILAVAVLGITPALAASKTQCESWSDASDRNMGGCRSTFLSGNMQGQRKAQCCQYRLETIQTWQACTAFFGAVDTKSLAQSKREWGCS